MEDPASRPQRGTTPLPDAPKHDRPRDRPRHMRAAGSINAVIRTTRRNDGTVVVSVDGEVDMSNANEFRQKLLDAVAGSSHAVVVDLSDCGFIDSSGLNALVEASHKLIPGSAPLALVGVQPHLRTLLDITRLDDLFDVSSARRTVADSS